MSYLHVFDPAVKYEDKEYAELTFDFEKLTGQDLLAVEREMRDAGIGFVTPESSRDCLCRLAARAAGVGSDMLIQLPLAEFNHIALMVRGFLIGMDLPKSNRKSGSKRKPSNSQE